MSKKAFVIKMFSLLFLSLSWYSLYWIYNNLMFVNMNGKLGENLIMSSLAALSLITTFTLASFEEKKTTMIYANFTHPIIASLSVMISFNWIMVMLASGLLNKIPHGFYILVMWQTLTAGAMIVLLYRLALVAISVKSAYQKARMPHG